MALWRIVPLSRYGVMADTSVIADSSVMADSSVVADSSVMALWYDGGKLRHDVVEDSSVMTLWRMAVLWCWGGLLR